MLIKLSNASLTYMPKTLFETKALDDVSFSLEEGEAAGIVGPAGSGKSTLGQVLAGLLPVDEGSLFINGRVTFLFQKPEKQMFEADIFSEVAFGARNLGLSEERVKELVKWALASVGLDFEHYKDRSPFNLSGGEMRRVAIASVLAMDSDAFIMDEPTAGLDPHGKRLVINFLKGLKKQGKSLVLISHDSGGILEVCERLVKLDKGRILR